MTSPSVAPAVWSASIMREIASERRRFGYRRIGLMLEREGIAMNEKKLRRLYREEGLAVKRRRGRKLVCPQESGPCFELGQALNKELRHGQESYARGDHREAA